MTEKEKLQEWRDEYDAEERKHETALQAYNRELLDLQRAQVKYARNTDRNLGLTATIVAIMFILYIIGQVLSFMNTMAVY